MHQKTDANSASPSRFGSGTANTDRVRPRFEHAGSERVGAYPEGAKAFASARCSLRRTCGFLAPPIRKSVALLIAVVIVLAACSTGVLDPVPGERAPDPTPAPENGTERRALALRGDPSFHPDQLQAVQRDHYEHLWRELNDLDNHARIMQLAAADCVFVYGRTLNSHVQSVLTAFRITGDLALLDHVDEIAQTMRGELHDSWRDTLDGTDGTSDGYLNWVYRHNDRASTMGKDVNRQLDEMNAHALVAMIAYTLDHNRDLPSPSGRDYAAHADFWRDYLVNHFEAKWRERRGVPTGFPIMVRRLTHIYYAWTNWHYFMWRLTGDDGYGHEAHRMADNLWRDVRDVSTPAGTAYVWSHGVSGEGAEFETLPMLPYGSSVLGDIVTFHLEGFHDWSDVNHVRSFARTITELIIDTDDPVTHGFAPDIGGGADRAGYSAHPDRPRRSITSFAGYRLALLSAWDSSGELASVSLEVQERRESTDTTNLAVGLLLHATMVPPAVIAAAP